jgi:hypothetical protein
MKKLLCIAILALGAITYPPVHADSTYPPVCSADETYPPIIKSLNAITYPPVSTPDETYPPIAQ